MAEMRVMTGRVLGKLRHIQRAHINRARGIQLFQHGRGHLGCEIAPDFGSAGRNLPRAIIHILMHHRHTTQRAERFARLARGIHRRRLFQGAVAI